MMKKNIWLIFMFLSLLVPAAFAQATVGSASKPVSNNAVKLDYKGAGLKLCQKEAMSAAGSAQNHHGSKHHERRGAHSKHHNSSRHNG